MSKLIRLSDRDIQSLEKIKGMGPIQALTQPPSYEQTVVVKPWGYEFLVFQNEFVAVWRLRVEKGHATSMHCHPKKKTSLVVLTGQALCNTFFNRNYLSGVDGVIIEAGVFHSTQAISQDGCDIIEIETPPDKLDLVRLDDQYGRSGKGYEGLSQMKTGGLERYDYFSFTEPTAGECQKHTAQKFTMEIISIPEERSFEKSFGYNKGEFFCPCQGSIVDSKGEVVADVGDVAEGAYLGIFENVTVKANSLLLHFIAV